VTLLESVGKKVDFLRTVVKALELPVTIIQGRAEELSRPENGGLRESFAAVTARAVAPLQVLAEYTLPFVHIGGQLIAFKGKAVREEMSQAESIVKRLGGEISNHITIELEDGMTHAFVIIEKIAITPREFPRKQSKIKRDRNST
jgi:16S rRNA (guanine527-N7)-methyltransferase